MLNIWIAYIFDNISELAGTPFMNTVKWLYTKLNDQTVLF